MKIILTILLILSLFGCSTSQNQTLENYSRTNLNCGFDTLCQLDAYVENEEEFDKYYNRMLELFTYYNNLFDIYNNYEGINNVKTINDNAGIAPVEVDPVIIEMIELAESIYEISGGAFDITDGATLKIWHNYREEGQILNSNGEYGNIPSKEELDTQKEYRGYEYIEINKENNTVFITDENVSLDVGGIAKGFATEKIAQELESMGLAHGAVNAGGNQRIIGTKGDGTGYNVGISDPRGSNSVIAVLPNQIGVSVVTSGDYQNYYIANDTNRYAHIIDPKTSFPATYYYSVSIVIEDSGLADCLSTAFFVLDYEDGLELVDKVNEAYGIDVIVVWISAKPLDETSLLSPISQETQYITTTENFRDKLIIE